MKDSSRQLLDKAERAIAAAELLLDGDYLEFAAGRAYYAMFYTAEALLNEKDLRFSKHGGVHGAFGEYFVKAGIIDEKYHRWLLTSFNRRIVGDYGVEIHFIVEEVQSMIDQAKEFLEEAKKILHQE